MKTNLPAWRASAPAGVPLAAVMPPPSAPPAPVLESTPGRSRYDMAVPLHAILRPEVAARWTGWAAKDYTPERIEQVLRNGLYLDHVTQWELFWMMEDTWPELAKCLAELRRGVMQMDWRVEPWAEDDAAPTATAQERASLVSHAVWTMRPRAEEAASGFEGTLQDLLDAWAKGTSVVEIEWEMRARRGTPIWCPKSTQWVHPRHYLWQPSGELALRLDAPETAVRGYAQRVETVPFPEGKFLIAQCRARSGPILGSALLRPLAWWWCATNFSAGWLLNLAQVFGLPLRWANYDPNATDAQILKICDMLERLGHAGWAAFPAGTQLDLKEPAKGAGEWPQEGLLDRADRQARLLILGQTLTSDVGDRGSFAAGKVHAGVREEIIQGAADWAASVLNQQLVPVILRLNYGDDAEAPEFCPAPAEQADLVAEAERIVKLAPVMPIPADWAYRRQKIPKPQAGEEVLGRQATPGPGTPERKPTPPQDPEDPEAPEAADPRDPAQARRRTDPEPPRLPDTAGRVARAAAAEMAQEFRGALAPVRQILAASTSQADFEARLRAHYADWQPGRIAAVVERVLQVCAAAGASEIFDGR